MQIRSPWPVCVEIWNLIDCQISYNWWNLLPIPLGRLGLGHPGILVPPGYFDATLVFWYHLGILMPSGYSDATWVFRVTPGYSGCHPSLIGLIRVKSYDCFRFGFSLYTFCFVLTRTELPVGLRGGSSLHTHTQVDMHGVCTNMYTCAGIYAVNGKNGHLELYAVKRKKWALTFLWWTWG